MRKNTKGFTLIELLVVIAIIGLLATIAVVALNTARRSSRDTKRIGDVKQVQTGLELYYNATAQYVVCSNVAGDVAINEMDTHCTQGTGGSTLKTNYLGGLDNIKDPSSPTKVCTGLRDVCEGTNTSTCEYGFNESTDTTTYAIYFYMEDAAGSIAKGCNRATPSGIASFDLP